MMATRAQATRSRAITGSGLPADTNLGTFAVVDLRTYFDERAAQLRAGVLARLREVHIPLTATMLRQHLGAGMRELDKVLQQLRKDGLIHSRRRYWELVP